MINAVLKHTCTLNMYLYPREDLQAFDIRPSESTDVNDLNPFPPCALLTYIFTLS